MSKVDTIEIVKDGAIKITHEKVPIELPFELVLFAADLITERYGREAEKEIRYSEIEKATNDILKNINHVAMLKGIGVKVEGPFIRTLIESIAQFVIKEVNKK